MERVARSLWQHALTEFPPCAMPSTQRVVRQVGTRLGRAKRDCLRADDGGQGRSTSYADATPPHDGTSPAEMAATLRKYADQGISHVQLVLDPITVESIQEFRSGPGTALD